MPVAIACKTCSKEFLAPPSVVNRKKYCSRKCYHPMSLLSHGESRTRLHVIWCSMKARCRSNKGKLLKYYSGRGITVCDEWKTYEGFREWAMANGYREDLELDRKDNSKGYSPHNCRWATRTQQMRNTRKRSSAKTSKYKGVSLCRGSNKWRAQICTGDKAGVPSHLGLYATEEEAARVYDTTARKLFGEFAVTNFKE